MNNKKITIIALISFVGLLAGIFVMIITKNRMLYYYNDQFMDFVNTFDVVDAVYEVVGKGGRSYFPFTYIALIIIRSIFKNALPCLFVTFLLVVLTLFIWYVRNIKENLSWIIVLIFTSYPLIFDFDRGNVEYLVLASLLLFFICYRRKSYYVAACALSLPICMKLYPAVFIILFLKDKKYKAFFVCIVYTCVLMLGSFIALGGNASNLEVGIANFKHFSNSYAMREYSMQFGHTIWSGINYINLVIPNSLSTYIFTQKYISIYTICIIFLASFLSLYILLLEKSKWKIITILTIMMLIFPHVSFDYTLINMYIPILFFIECEDMKKWEEIVYSILFGLAIIPMNWNQLPLRGVLINAGNVIRPTIMMGIIILIITTTIMDLVKKSKSLNTETKEKIKLIGE